MRRLLLPLLFVLGCTGRTLPLDVPRSGPDAGRPLDAGALDAGAPDAAVPDSGPVDPNACRYDGEVDIDLRIEVDGPEPFWDGPARIVGLEPLRLTYGREQLVRISLSGVPWRAAGLRRDDFVWLQFGAEIPMWTNAAVAIRWIAPNDGPGPLRLAAWALGEVDEELELPEVSLFYRPDDCRPSEDLEGCGAARTEALTAAGPATGIEIPAGTEAQLGDLRIGNGRSHRYAPVPTCTDTPFVWHEGYVIGG